MVALQHAVERGDVGRHVVDDLDGRRMPAAQEYTGHADERLDVAVVRHGRDARDEPVGEAVLAADPGRGGRAMMTVRWRTDSKG